MKMYRQGDIILLKEDDEQKPRCEGEPTPGFLVVAEGEKTGHNHVLMGPGITFFGRWQNPPDDIHIPAGARLVHPEHAPLDLEHGHYRVIRQREYRYGDGERRVED